MFSLEIINALNDPDNPAKPKGLNAKLKHKKTQATVTLEELESLAPLPRHETNAQASAALDRREERNISHYSGGRFRY